MVAVKPKNGPLEREIYAVSIIPVEMMHYRSNSIKRNWYPLILPLTLYAHMHSLVPKHRFVKEEYTFC